MSRLPRNNSRSLLVTAFMGSGVILYLMFVFLPTQRSISELRGQLAEKRTYVLAVDTEYTRLPAIRQEIENTDEYLRSVGHSVDEAYGMAGLLSQITASALESQVNVQKIMPREAAVRSMLSEHALDLTVEGAFPQIVRFVSQLETWPGNLWFGRVHFEDKRGDRQDLACRLNLTVFTKPTDSSD